jgi:hypothetical protein
MKNIQEYKNFTSRVCELSGCEVKYLKTKIRKKEFVRARYLIIAYRIFVCGLSRANAASVFGIKRCTTYHILKTIRLDYLTTEGYREMFSEIFEKYPMLVN